jgi:hypothetical protein
MLPIKLSVAARPRLERLIGAAATFVGNLDTQSPLFAPSETKVHCRLLHFIRLLKWMIFADGNFRETEFTTVYALYEAFARRHTQPLDLHLLACIRLFTFFPTALTAPHFAGFYDEVMSKIGNDCYKGLIAFRKFRHCIPALSLEHLQFIVNHKSFPVLRLGFPGALGGRSGDALDAFVARLTRHADDPVCQEAIGTLLDIDFTRLQVRSPIAYAQLLEAVVDVDARFMEKVRKIASGKAVGIPTSLAAAFGRVLCRHELLDPLAVDLDAFVNAIAQSREVNLLPLTADFLSAMAPTGESFRRVIGQCRSAMDNSTAVGVRERLATFAVCFIARSEQAAEELREFYQYLKDRQFGSVIESAFYPALLNVWNGSAGWAEAFVLACTDSQAEEYGGFGKAGAFFRAVVHRMEGENAKTIIQRFAAHGPPTKDGEWRMLSIIFERFPQHAAEFRTILELDESIPIVNADLRRSIELVVGHPVEEIPRSESESFDTMERSGSEEHGFKLQEAPLSPGPDDD